MTVIEWSGAVPGAGSALQRRRQSYSQALCHVSEFSVVLDPFLLGRISVKPKSRYLGSTGLNVL